MQDLLNYVLLGQRVEQWFRAAAFIAGGFIAGKLCSWILALVLKHGASKTKSKLDDIVIAGLRLPLVLLITLGGIGLGLYQLVLSPPAALWADRILSIALILILAVGLNRIIGALILHYVPSKGRALIKGEAALQPVLRNFFETIVWIFAGVLILRKLGYNISALLAGLGLGGAALALASKDTLSNVFGSITVLVDKPFHINDRIKIGSYDGVITEIGIRTSRLRTLENRIVVIPNSLFAATPIENVSSAPHSKVSQTIQVKGDNSSEKIEEGLALLRELHKAVPGLEGPPVAALVSVGGLFCQISLIYNIAKNADYWATINGVNLETLRRFEGAGIRLM
ncbi:MscS Mechanosensitive ion channel [Treponema primitia ZAS-2]|uniref:MscS Mechanosensitive ion channel n=1 Tax=Treponema primitia (strain ATCC BAA-887 / DSM 12427 / ZAS-2) TaxID=545694 RepID=F5YH87_TREPZ|nr:mechanosensitive ion channel domain-containing protein [Treponema primitia]AEF83977.1 MscS Mechanosensitive ion channel [Treponema primitia ZAS-2]